MFFISRGVCVPRRDNSGNPMFCQLAWKYNFPWTLGGLKEKKDMGRGRVPRAWAWRLPCSWHIMRRKHREDSIVSLGSTLRKVFDPATMPSLLSGTKGRVCTARRELFFAAVSESDSTVGSGIKISNIPTLDAAAARMDGEDDPHLEAKQIDHPYTCHTTAWDRSKISLPFHTGFRICDS